jgi:hypothetical protein
VSIYPTTFTVAPRPRREPAFMPLGAGTGRALPAGQPHWVAQAAHVERMSVLGHTVTQLNLTFTRDRAAGAAKQGRPPRGTLC